MSDKPWAEPGIGVEERAKRLAIARATRREDVTAEALRAAKADALEEAAVLLDDQASVQTGLVAAIIRAGAVAIRALKAGTFHRPSEPAPPADSEADRYRALAEEGKTGKQVAAELGVSYPRVVRLLHKSGFFRDKAARREAQAREGMAAVARGATITAAAASLGVRPGWLADKLADLFQHDHPFIRHAEPPHEFGPCLWCGHPYLPYHARGDYDRWGRCPERVKAVARGDEAAMLDHHQRHARDRDASPA